MASSSNWASLPIMSNPAMRQGVLNVYPNAKFHDIKHHQEDELIEFLRDCDAAIIGFEPVTDRVLSALPHLKLISKYGNGCETFDFEAMSGTTCASATPGASNKLAVAELTLGFMLNGAALGDALNVTMRAGEREFAMVVSSPGAWWALRLRKHRQGSRAAARAVQLQDHRLRRQGHADFYKQWNVTPVSLDGTARTL
jgi:lactate dehydrogenase-like 2-hydroxyacid dehydrogenase